MWVERDTTRGIGISGIFEPDAEDGARTVGICGWLVVIGELHGG